MMSSTAFYWNSLSFSATLSGFATFYAKPTKRMAFLESAGCSWLPRNASILWNFTLSVVSAVANNALLQTFERILEDETIVKEDMLNAAKGFIRTL